MDSTKIIQILITLSIFYFSFSSVLAANPTFNVLSYGAKPDGKSDCTKAFLTAWSAACATAAPATIYVPAGRYMLPNAVFSGDSCKSTAVTIRIDGTLVAPSDYNVIGNSENWLKFERVTGVSIYGGTLDAQGTKLWACKNSGKSCPKGTTSLAFYHSDNIIINGVSSINSQMFHVLVYGCRNAKLMNMKISAPGNSPNTDGIHVQKSSGVTILASQIGTGDDCVSLGPGATNVWIENLTCGPGHGVSIGSLGWDLNEAGVQNVTVKSVKFTGTQNGVRVKSWARPSNGFVKDVVYQHLTMVDVQNPIIIDQNYCPGNKNCPHQSSGVKISHVTYEDIRGSSATKVAVKLDCSKTVGCTGITLDNIMLNYQDEPAAVSCVNAAGSQDRLFSCLN